MPPSGRCFWLMTLETEGKKNKKSQHQNELQVTFAGRVCPKLNDVPCNRDACRGYVYSFTPLAAVCGCCWPKTFLWHAFLTDHTCSSHENGSFRPKCTFLSTATLQVDVFGPCAASKAQNALNVRYVQRALCMSPRHEPQFGEQTMWLLVLARPPM